MIIIRVDGRVLGSMPVVISVARAIPPVAMPRVHRFGVRVNEVIILVRDGRGGAVVVVATALASFTTTARLAALASAAYSARLAGLAVTGPGAATTGVRVVTVARV